MRYSKPIRWILRSISRIVERYQMWYCWEYVAKGPGGVVIQGIDMGHFLANHADEIAAAIEENNALIQQMKQQNKRLH